MNVARKTEQEFMTSGEVARVLGVSNQHVHQLAVGGLLPVAIRTGKGMRLFRVTDVERLAKERKESPPKTGPKPGFRKVAKGTKKKAAKVTKKKATSTTTKGSAKA